MKISSLPNLLLPAALALLSGVSLALPAVAASTAASSASDSASSAVGSLSTSIGQSSRSSSKGDLAAGDWRVVDVAEAPAGTGDGAVPGPALLALTLQAEPGGTELVLKLPRALAERQALVAGERLSVRRQGWGFELARAGVAEPFFLVVDDTTHRELGSRQVGA